MKCHRCGSEISGDDSYSYHGQVLCEDCYISAISPERTCDPWASYLSGRERQDTDIKGANDLTETEKRVYEFIKDRGRTTRGEVMAEFGLSAPDLDPQLNVLMHAELVKERSEGDTMYLIPVPVTRQ